MKKLNVIVIGAGNRGNAYADFMKWMPDQFSVTGVAEPIRERREYLKKECKIPDENCCADYHELLDRPKFADLAVIATMDDMHFEPAMKAIERGYHLLLEKPVAQTAEECAAIARAAKEKNVKVLVGHVLRYTPFYKKVKEIVMEGKIGQIISVMAVEAVGNIHQSHSYVRGDWHREDETTPMLLAKCCHDLDIIQWLIGKPCRKVSSFGELTWFRPENAPEGAPKRCIDGGCPAADTCPYNCRNVYIDHPVSWMRTAVARGYSKDRYPEDEEVLEGLRHTNFGACVYHADNNVVDHQVVNMEFEGGATASLTMNAFNKGGRYIRVFGTKGELFAKADDAEIEAYFFEDRRTEKIPVGESLAGGHGGGDQGIVRELYEYLNGTYSGYCAADIDISVKNHMIGFAAEKARREDTVVDVAKFCEAYGFAY